MVGGGDAGALFDGRSIHGRDEFPVALAQSHLVFAASGIKVPVKRLGAPDFFAVKKAANAGAVEMPIGRRLQASDVAEGGKQIHTADGRALHSVWLDPARPSHDARHANATLIHAALFVAQTVSLAMRMKAGARGTVVAGKKHKGVLAQFLFVQLRHQSTEAGVHLGDVGPVGGVAGVSTWVILFKARIAGNGLVWFMEADEEEKGLRFVTPRAQPMDGLIGDDARSITLEQADGRAVADKVPRVAMIG